MGEKTFCGRWLADYQKTESKQKTVKRQWESIEQRNLIIWAFYHPIAKEYLFSIPNGGHRGNKRAAHAIKMEGAKRGVPDLMLAYPVMPWAGLFIELKATKLHKSVIGEEQKAWHEKLKKVGYAVVVCYGAIEAQQAITEYLQGKHNDCKNDGNVQHARTPA